jgi:uncharacterized membrane-anchored protein YjiN (DUF445 family)
MIELSRTRLVAKSIRDHSAISADPEIESYLAQHLAVVFYAEVEKKVEELIVEVFRRYSDDKIATFLQRNQASIISRIKKSDLADFAKSFGDEVKEAFTTALSDNEVTSYSNIITARHKVGHGPGSEIQIRDIESGTDVAEKILNTLDQLLKP